MKRVTVNQQMYQIFLPSQLLGLIDDLEHHKRINLKYSYCGPGGDLWYQFLNEVFTKKEYYVGQANELVQNNADYLAFKLQQYKTINLIEIGPGNGPSRNILIDALHRDGVAIRYTGIDVSWRMNEILEQQIKERYSDISVETIIEDLDAVILHDRLFDNKMKYPDSCNVILLLGSTYGNLWNRNRFLQNLNYSMGKDDFFILDNGLDTPERRSNFQTLQNPISVAKAKWIPDLLGISEDLYDAVNKFEPKTRMRVRVLCLRQDVEIVFWLHQKEKMVRLYQGDEICVWHHYGSTFADLEEELDRNGFYPCQLTLSSDNSRILALCEIGKEFSNAA
jgi:hypothetical protein